MSIGLAIFASVVLVLAVYHKQFRKVLLYAIAVGVVLSAIGFAGVYLYNRHKAAKYEKHRQAVNSCVERNKNVGDIDIFDQIAATGKSLEERCESDPTLNITPTKTQTKTSTPEIIPIYVGETLKIVKAGEETGARKVTPIAGAIPLLYMGRGQKFTVTCGTYEGNINGSNPSFNLVIEGTTITCK
jgi:hypothetical protein